MGWYLALQLARSGPGVEGKVGAGDRFDGCQDHAGGSSWGRVAAPAARIRPDASGGQPGELGAVQVWDAMAGYLLGCLVVVRATERPARFLTWVRLP